MDTVLEADVLIEELHSWIALVNVYSFAIQLYPNESEEFLTDVTRSIVIELVEKDLVMAGTIHHEGFTPYPSMNCSYIKKRKISLLETQTSMTSGW